MLWFYDENIHPESLDIRSEIQKQPLPTQQLFNYSPFLRLVSFKIVIEAQKC